MKFLPDHQVNEIILHELRGLREEVREGFSETKQRLTAIESVTEPFFANDGEKVKIQDDIDGLKKAKYAVLGGAGILTTAGHFLLHLWTGK